MLNEMMKALGENQGSSVETILNSGMTKEEIETAIDEALRNGAGGSGGVGGASSRPNSRGTTLTMAALEEKLRGMSEKQLQDMMAAIPRETLIDKVESMPKEQLDKFITRAMLHDALRGLNRNQVGGWYGLIMAVKMSLQPCSHTYVHVSHHLSFSVF